MGKGPGRPHKLNESHLEVVRELAMAPPHDAIHDLARRFHERTGVFVDRFLMSKTLKRAGIERTESVDRSARAPAPTRDRHRFSEAHRRRAPPDGYASSVSDYEWELVHDIFERPGPVRPGRPPKYPRRLMLDAIFYAVRTGCSWRMLPRGFPKWEVVYATFRDWTAKGWFDQMHARLSAMWRERAGRDAQPTAAILDSQSVRSSPQGGEHGFDANKKIKGRKRHIATDVLGLLLAVAVTAASVQDRDAAMALLASTRTRHPRVQLVFVDSGYAGRAAEDMRRSGVRVEVIRRSDTRQPWVGPQLQLFPVAAQGGFHIMPKRWVVERTHAWNESPRRCARDHDRRTDVAASWLWIGQSRMLLSRFEAGAASQVAAA